MALLFRSFAYLLLLAATPAYAQFVNIPADEYGGRFFETASGKYWLDLDVFSGKSYNEIEAALANTPYRIATRAEVQRLFDATDDFVGVAVEEIFRCSVNFTCLIGYYDDTASGTDPSRVGVGSQTRGFFSPGPVADGLSDDSDPRTQVRAFAGAWMIQRVPALHPSSNFYGTDFDGDGIDEKVVWREPSGTWYIRFSASNEVFIVQWGLPGDAPIVGDYDGDRIPDIVVWRPQNGTWYILTSTSLFDRQHPIIQQFGLPKDTPIRSDYDGDGRLDLAVWRPSNGTYYYVKSMTAEVVTEQWGLATDIPANGARQATDRR